MTSTEGIILRRIPYRSSGAVIDILTPTGKTGALLKGLDKKTPRYGRRKPNRAL